MQTCFQHIPIDNPRGTKIWTAWTGIRTTEMKYCEYPKCTKQAKGNTNG